MIEEGSREPISRERFGPARLFLKRRLEVLLIIPPDYSKTEFEVCYRLQFMESISNRDVEQIVVFAEPMLHG